MHQGVEWHPCLHPLGASRTSPHRRETKILPDFVVAPGVQIGPCPGMSSLDAHGYLEGEPLGSGAHLGGEM